ncbi:hypothetical protein ENSA5_25550 [Enhygromyxa salina]|uniref:Gram-negative bacterial tonB protein n=1 Tax=Enhygromyxa salina TaxID=215803 RepID=A0A2S9YAT2_9BACT|nr:AgmX/PglI C-terminal domain-containing protein [Enhygromyxa salina]PRQ02220.1 hypothetical protein ENSA5_25550 [Enhygromyxa salina]
MSRAPLLLALALTLTACAHRATPSADARVAVVEANMGELQQCWDDLAGAYPGRAGSMLFSVDLRRNGTVDWVEIDADELGVAKLSACTVRRIKRWRFPEDRKRRSITFGVGFSSPGPR